MSLAFPKVGSTFSNTRLNDFSNYYLNREWSKVCWPGCFSIKNWYIYWLFLCQWPFYSHRSGYNNDIWNWQLINTHIDQGLMFGWKKRSQRNEQTTVLLLWMLDRRSAYFWGTRYLHISITDQALTFKQHIWKSVDKSIYSVWRPRIYWSKTAIVIWGE